MNLAINFISSFNPKHNFHGGREYANAVVEKLIEKCMEEKSVNLYFLVKEVQNVDIVLRESLEKFNWIQLIVITDYKDLERVFADYKIDRFYDPMWNGKIPSQVFKNIEAYLTIHGLRSIEMPTDRYEFYLAQGIPAKLKALFKMIFKDYFKEKVVKLYNSLLDIQAKNLNVIVPSQHTHNSIRIILKNEIVERTNIVVLASPKPASQSNTDSHIDINKEFGLNVNGFFLCVSGARWVKNSIRVLKSFNLLYEKGYCLDYKLVITGISDPRKLSKYINNKNVILLPYVPNDTLSLLFKYCFCFVYPSLNEGFGYPPIEAMRYGKPVIASCNSSIPEVCGNAPVYFNPYDTYELANRVLGVVQNIELYKIKSQESYENYKRVRILQQQDLEKLTNKLLY